MHHMERATIDGMRVHVLPTNRFKTYAISVYIGCPIDEDTVTPTAVIPFVLRRGNRLFPETKAFREKLADLYGAGFAFDVNKIGDYQLVQFRFDIIQEQFVTGSEHLLFEGLQFIGHTLFHPLLEENIFRPSYVESEKATVKARIESQINNKIRYAANRCIEEMFRNEPYRLHPLGKIDQLNTLTTKMLTERYEQWINNSAIDIYVVGNTTIDEVRPMIENAFRSAYRTQIADPVSYKRSKRTSGVPEVNTVVESLDVNQGKLNIGLRVPATFADPSYATALVYNGILGAYPHSKLFLNVREKESLAYYAASSLNGHKGFMMIQSGIEVAQAKKTLQIIKEQLEMMKMGEISELEMNQTKAMLKNQLRETQDSVFDIISFDFNHHISGVERSNQQLIEQIEQVNKEDIQSFAQQVHLDTVYLLKGLEGGAELGDDLL